MPTLTLLRHAKAAQPIGGSGDFDRPLTDRGRADAAAAGMLLAHAPLDLALVSAARRTSETWQIASRAFAEPPRELVEPDLYLCSPEMLISRLRQLPPTIGRVVVVGHNPCMQELAMFLAGRLRDAGAYAIGQRYPTAALATFRLDRPDWARLDPAEARLERFATPDRTL